jgi:rhodanese-related sulfurtransferase
VRYVVVIAGTIALILVSVIGVGQAQGDGVRRITPQDALAAVEKGQAIIVDVRGEDSYKHGHVKGSRLIPVNDVGSRIGELPRDKMIITYCS